MNFRNDKKASTEKVEAIKDRMLGARVYSIFIILFIACIISLVWGIKQYNQKKFYSTYLGNQFDRNFYILGDDIRNLNALLQKSALAGSNKEKTIIYAEIWRQSYSAQETLGTIPIQHIVLNKTSKYLKQLGDYNYMLLKKIAENKKIDNDNEKKLEQFAKYSQTLQNDIYALTNKLESNNMSFIKMASEGTDWMRNTSKKMPSNAMFSMIQKTFNKYPSLIYDGPYSDHVVYEKRLATLEGKEITKSQAIKIAKQYIKNKIINININDTKKEIQERSSKTKKFGVVDNPKNVQVTKEDTYFITCKLEDGGENYYSYIEISKKQGKLVSLISTKVNQMERISLNQAEKNANKFMALTGYDNMTPSYFQKYDGSVVINYVFKNNQGIIFYPDMIKVKVDLNDGEILGFDSVGYLTYHKDRENYDKAMITAKQAESNIMQKFNIKATDLAVIPLDTKKEVLCYEFKGIYNKKYFIVYINAKNGTEENIVQIIDTSRGKLAI